MSESQFIGVSESAQRLGLHRTTLGAMLRRKDVPAFCYHRITETGRYRMSRAAVDYFVAHARWPSSTTELSRWRADPLTEPVMTAKPKRRGRSSRAA